MVCTESELRLVDLFTFQSNWVNLYGALALASEITFAEKKIISR